MGDLAAIAPASGVGASLIRAFKAWCREPPDFRNRPSKKPSGLEKSLELLQNNKNPGKDAYQVQNQSIECSICLMISQPGK